ncbi:MAG TPA: hypothetical protein VFX75_01990 [Nitrososphaeraceae archaeon]|nr:hypothetical protein [Nitrososphaeraceae archaeon]
MNHTNGRISVNEIGPESCYVYLYLTKPDDVLPIIEIDVHLADTGLENNEIAIYIMRKLAEQEDDKPFADVLAKSILDDYQNPKPWVKEGIVHTICQPHEPSKVTSRYIEVKYRMQVAPYPEVDEFAHHGIDEGGIVKSLLSYIKSLHEIYSRIYTNKVVI